MLTKHPVRHPARHPCVAFERGFHDFRRAPAIRPCHKQPKASDQDEIVESKYMYDYEGSEWCKSVWLGVTRATAACAATLILAGGAFWPCPGADAASQPMSPYTRGFNLEYGLTKEGRIRKCDSGAQPNCISTSSTTNLYGTPWLTRGQEKIKGAMADFDAAIATVTSGKATLEEEKVLEYESNVSEGEIRDNGVSLQHAIYRRYSIPSPFEYDYVEVLIAPFEGSKDDETQFRVTYRSQASTTKYIWPIQQPISDFGAQKKRMDALRLELHWQNLGGDCSLLECFY